MINKNLILATIAIAMLAVGCNKQADDQNAINTPAIDNTNNAQSNTTQNSNDAVKNIFTDSAHKVMVDYSGLNMIAKAPASYIPAQSYFTTNGKDLLTLYLNPTTYKGTNLESAWFNLAINEKLTIKTCYAKIPNQGFTTAFTQKRLVQGNTWYYAQPNPIGDAAAGHQQLSETYRLYKNNLCYEVRLGLTKFTRDNLEKPDSVKEIDTQKIFTDSGAVLNNVQIQ